jgi:hypothetical protein
VPALQNRPRTWWGAHTLVSQAEQSGGQQYASANLEAAAELALARTRALKAEQSLRQVNSGTATLQSESERERAAPAAPMPPAGAPTPQYQ